MARAAIALLQPTQSNKKPPDMPRFENVSCSQCGHDFGPGDHGYSHCEDHRPEGWPPFREGDTVEIKSNKHLGLHRVDTCEWYTRTWNDPNAYWLCECIEIREPIDWSKIPAGANGIVVSSVWRGSSDHLIAIPSDDRHPVAGNVKAGA